uniref:Complement component 1 Q subcomponent-binding protein, mitochondrial n=1 Tax=Arion vulgaris TaxID=1028688 RepID=A0A0B6Y706_9EUPU
MAKTLKLVYSITSKLVSSSSTTFLTKPGLASRTVKQLCASSNTGVYSSSRAHHSSMLSSILSRPLMHTTRCQCLVCTRNNIATYSTEVEKELSKFLENEIKYESSRTADKLPKISGFEIKTEGADVTLTRTSGEEKIVLKLSVNGAVDAVASPDTQEKEDEPPQMACRPPFNIEITKGGKVLALQCSFPSQYPEYDEQDQPIQGKPEAEQFDDEFEIQEVTFHGGEWTDGTYSVSADTMDPELFDLLMDMLDERGINDEFIAHLIDFCTAYENKQYVNFLQNLKKFVEK